MRFLLIILTFISFITNAQNIDFNTYFVNKTMRVDYIHTGDSVNEIISLKQIKQEPFWGGSHKNLIDTFRYGRYMCEILDSASKKMIYSRGYNALFQEWQTYAEAKTIRKSFYETLIFPYPKKTVTVNIKRRYKNGNYKIIFSLNINPSDFMINKEKSPDFKTFSILNNGSSDKKLDIVFLFDGYTKSEIEKLHNDAKRFADYFWSYEPFKNYKDKFNIWGVETFSDESGTDIPGKNIWKRTSFNSSFYTFRSERYLTTQDMKSVRDAASLVPYDQIYIIVNTAKYGGGGIFNFWNLTASDNPMSKWVFLHEFGHGFAGLADEYVDNEISDDFYDKSVEPWEPNITNRVNFASKWQDLIKKGTPIPTPDNEKYNKTVGLFEGAGYVAKGVYRPYRNCEMRQLQQGFCPVCSRAIIKMIKFYSE